MYILRRIRLLMAVQSSTAAAAEEVETIVAGDMRLGNNTIRAVPVRGRAARAGNGSQAGLPKMARSALFGKRTGRRICILRPMLLCFYFQLSKMAAAFFSSSRIWICCGQTCSHAPHSTQAEALFSPWKSVAKE